MKEIKIQKFTLIKLIYSILIVVFLISVFLPYYSKSYAFPPPPAEPIISYTKPYLGYIELIYGGWPGLILAIISIVILNPERKGKSLLIGGLGFALILINLMIRPTIQTITIEFGFYLSLVFSIGLFIINVFAFISKEGIVSLISDKREPIVKIKPTIAKQKEIQGTDWEKKEFIKTQTIDYIKEVALKSKELPFYDIISKTGIERKNLDKVVRDMISDKEINARVRDFVILFKRIPKEKREEEPDKIKKDLQKKMSEIDQLIKENNLNKAILDLSEVSEVAKKYKFESLVNEAKEKINNCKELEIENDLREVKTNLQTSLSNIEKLIDENKINDALEELVEIKETAQENNLDDFIEKIDEKIEVCKNFQYNTINKIKNTIVKYGSKLARLELMDISEKSGIQDENLIEKIILEMIKTREINAEYFTSSKSIAFYQQEKETAQASKPKEFKQLMVFLSYSTLDADHFKIADIVKALEKYPEIKKASYWQADSKQNIVEFMEDTLKNTDVFVLFCSKNSVKSNAVKDEWQAAFQMRKKGMLKIIPIYENEDDVPVLLWQMLNVKFEKDDFNAFIEKLHEEILR